MSIIPNKKLARSTNADLDAVTIGGARRLDGQIELRDYDSAWPELFAREECRIRQALGEAVARIEHVGSTSVPGLAAKSIIDILLEVADSSDEPTYVAPLELCGYVLRIREPAWWEHRVFKGPDTDVNLHVFSRGCPEVDRMLGFRDRLRTCAADRELYLARKRELASRHWEYVQNYADAKSEIIEEIISRSLPSP